MPRRATRRKSKTFRLQAACAAGGLALLVLLFAGEQARVSATATPSVEQARFIGRVGGVAQRLHTSIGLQPSLVTAMAINETGWGTSELSSTANNYFGIKAETGDGTRGHVLYDTREVLDGHVVVVRAPFRAYGSLDESVLDLGNFLHTNSRYDALWRSADDPRASALILGRAGYATDPEWSSKLIGLIDAFGLEALDGPAWPPRWLAPALREAPEQRDALTGRGKAAALPDGGSL